MYRTSQTRDNFQVGVVLPYVADFTGAFDLYGLSVVSQKHSTSDEAVIPGSTVCKKKIFCKIFWVTRDCSYAI